MRRRSSTWPERYRHIPLAQIAYELQDRYERAPGTTFDVEPIVRDLLTQ